MLKVLRQLSVTTCELDPCPSWLGKANGEVQHPLSINIVRCPYGEVGTGQVPAALKEAVVRHITKEAKLGF